MLLWLAIAVAQDADPAAARAEAQRLAQEIAASVARTRWTAVERRYQQAVATGAPLPASVHLAGAEAARTRGDLGRVRSRLAAAIEAEPGHEEATRAIAALDRVYGRVVVKAWVGAALEDYDHHFDPTHVRVIDHAIAELAERGTFEGLLPPGAYTVDGDPFQVVAGREVVFDISLPELPPPEKLPWWKTL